MKRHEICLKLHHTTANYMIDKKTVMDRLVELQLWRVVTSTDAIWEYFFKG